jgi:hypothetical protein
VSGQLHAPVALPPGERGPITLWIGGWMGPRAGLDDVEKRIILTAQVLELRPLGRPARSQSLYRTTLSRLFPSKQDKRKTCPYKRTFTKISVELTKSQTGMRTLNMDLAVMGRLWVKFGIIQNFKIY